ncbi:MAG: RdgB/HAM1 family non-canonical purine NTP pyrophosphatase [Bacteroidales bacterium]
MKELIFATNNEHKLTEIRNLLDPAFKIAGLREIGILEEIPEDFPTLMENALQKAEFVYNRLGKSCFADDTGLEIEALNGEPGVYSARYSRIGDPVYPEMEVAAGNIRKVLEKLAGEKNRKARFRTVIALILDGKKHYFEGVVQGSITHDLRGIEGFGYDPVFMPDGTDLTFAEMELSRKNRISHRALAVKKLIGFLT